MRSSRTLEKECNRNIELMWLLKGLVPDHNTIANFRKDNSKAIARIFSHCKTSHTLNSLVVLWSLVTAPNLEPKLQEKQF
jgi:hypothetical protein